jgi:hypothetical protein
MVLSTILMVLCATMVTAEDQEQDVLILDSQTYTIAWPESPFILDAYIKQHKLELHGEKSETNKKGYHAIWTVRDRKLYLIGFDSRLEDDQSPGVKDLPGAKNGVLFAKWFTGTLTIKYGFQRPSGSAAEQSLRVDFENGVMVASDTDATKDDDTPQEVVDPATALEFDTSTNDK